MREAELKRKIVDEIRKEGGYARRIEDKYTVGMPDMFLIPPGCPCIWVEAKIINGNILQPTPRQFIELNKLWMPPHCYAFTVGWKEGLLYATTPNQSIHIKECQVQTLGESYGGFFRRCIAGRNDLLARSQKYVETVQSRSSAGASP